ncbi:Uncharacterised protein [Vibrio cholerae]|nr:Uncharacterised protein [Vibrio cholerae]
MLREPLLQRLHGLKSPYGTSLQAPDQTLEPDAVQERWIRDPLLVFRFGLSQTWKILIRVKNAMLKTYPKMSIQQR